MAGKPSRMGCGMKSEALDAPLLAPDVGVPALVREPIVRRMATRAWWVACLLPALLLFAIIARDSRAVSRSESLAAARVARLLTK
jgi:hypothetical protein